MKYYRFRCQAEKYRSGTQFGSKYNLNYGVPLYDVQWEVLDRLNNLLRLVATMFKHAATVSSHETVAQDRKFMSCKLRK